MLLTDLIILPFALWSAIAIRLGTFNPDVHEFRFIFILIPFFTIPIFYKLGLYRAVIRYLDFKFLMTVCYGVTFSALFISFIVFFARINSMPRSSFVIYWFFSALYIFITRLAARKALILADHRNPFRSNVAIYGAGKAGIQMSLALSMSKEFKPVAFFDDNDDLIGRVVGGLRVYSNNEIRGVLLKLGIKEIVLAIPSTSRSRRREIIESLQQYPVSLKTVPGITELVTGRAKVNEIRQVGIEDLLGRDAIQPNESLMRRCIFGKSVLVTGAGGSIGSELCRQIICLAPKRLILFEISEFGLYSIEKELRHLYPQVEIISVLGSVLNEDLFLRTSLSYEIKTIYHAAAYKHVPLVEFNPGAGLTNNAIGTLKAAEAAMKANVEYFVLISTDKAVRPTNIMGASKRLAEMIVQGMADERDCQTIFSMVRFGNVLGSSGSVVPLFKEQILRGGPVTVTDPEMVRYFMTIPEAAQLVIQAGAMSKGGEVFVLDMGEPLKILELAHRMILLSGLSQKNADSPDGDIEIVYTGLRPGEKMYEELLIDGNAEKTEHARIFKAHEKFLEKQVLMFHLLEMEKVWEKGDILSIRERLSVIVTEYRRGAF